MTRTCSDCPSPISRQSRGRCKPCSARRLNADPAIVARRRAGVADYMARPETKAALRTRLAEHAANMTDAERERRRARGRHIAATVLRTAVVTARSNSPEAKAAAGRGRTNTVLAWCPPAYRDRYRQLKASQRLLAAEARALIEAEIATDERRRLAAMSPLERDLERMRNGAALVDTFLPSRAAPAFTLGGVATGML